MINLLTQGGGGTVGYLAPVSCDHFSLEPFLPGEADLHGEQPAALEAGCHCRVD